MIVPTTDFVYMFLAKKKRFSENDSLIRGFEAVMVDFSLWRGEMIL